MDLSEYIGKYKRAAVAYSGGFDSTFLLRSVANVLPDDHIGIFVDSPLISERQRSAAIRIAEHLDLSVVIVKIGWEDMPLVYENNEERCYHCKKAIYNCVRRTASDFDAEVCMDGENADDLNDHRPGRRAAKEFGIVSPLSDLGISRRNVIAAVNDMRIPERIVKDTCMATRIPFGTPISEDMMRSVESFELAVRKMTGAEQLRIRFFGNAVTILTAPEELHKLLNRKDEVFSIFIENGYEPSIDEHGYNG